MSKYYVYVLLRFECRRCLRVYMFIKMYLHITQRKIKTEELLICTECSIQLYYLNYENRKKNPYQQKFTVYKF